MDRNQISPSSRAVAAVLLLPVCRPLSDDSQLRNVEMDFKP